RRERGGGGWGGCGERSGGGGRGGGGGQGRRGGAGRRRGRCRRQRSAEHLNVATADRPAPGIAGRVRTERDRERIVAAGLAVIHDRGGERAGGLVVRAGAGESRRVADDAQRGGGHAVRVEVGG